MNACKRVRICGERWREETPPISLSPGVDQLAPDLKRIIDEALFGTIWTRPGLDLKQRCIATISALMTQGELNLLRRHIVRALNVGLTPNQVVEIFLQSTFYIGVPAVESGLAVDQGHI